jgi:hypothetical protein
MNNKFEDELISMQRLLNQESMKEATKSLFSKPSLGKSTAILGQINYRKRSSSPIISNSSRKERADRISNISPKYYNKISILDHSSQYVSGLLSNKKQTQDESRGQSNIARNGLVDSGLNDSFQSIDNFIKTRTIIVSDEELEEQQLSSMGNSKNPRSKDVFSQIQSINQKNDDRLMLTPNIKSEAGIDQQLLSLDDNPINFATFMNEDSLVVNTDLKRITDNAGEIYKIEENAFVHQFDKHDRQMSHICELPVNEFTFNESTVVTERKEETPNIISNRDLKLPRSKIESTKTTRNQYKLEFLEDNSAKLTDTANRLSDFSQKNQNSFSNRELSHKATSPNLTKNSLKHKKLLPKANGLDIGKDKSATKKMDFDKTTKPYPLEDHLIKGKKPTAPTIKDVRQYFSKNLEDIDQYFTKQFTINSSREVCKTRDGSCSSVTDQRYRSTVTQDRFIAFRDQKLKNLLNNFM